MKNYNIKGFTLIELLVVISIISLLSSIVIASLRTARLKAQDSAIIQSVRQMANLMALEAGDNTGNSYSNLHRNWISYASDCTPSTAWGGNYDDQMTDLCRNIRDSQPSTYVNTMYISAPQVGGSNRFTIMAQLPYRSTLNISPGGTVARYVCIGSNGGFTIDGYYNGSIWTGAGCHGDTNF